MGRDTVAKTTTSLTIDPGERAVRFMNNLTHRKGQWAGQSFNLRPWQEVIIRKTFGTLRPDGRRQYRTVYIEIPRKNGKTELAAAVSLYLLLADREPAAEIYSAAVDRDQASLVYSAAAGMVTGDPMLNALCKVSASKRNILHMGSGSFYRAVPAEAAGRHGYDAHGIIYDELHAAPNRELYDVLTTSTGARRQPLIFVITTAGWDRTSICWELHEYAVRVRDGVVDDPTFLPVLYSAAEDADWTDEAVWAACNPALGDFRSIDEMREFANRAKAIPGLQNVFRRLYLCQWTEQADKWLDLATWDDQPPRLMDVWQEERAGLEAEVEETTDEDRLAEIVERVEEVRGLLNGRRRGWIGVDLSSTSDLTAVVVVFPDDAGGYDVYPFFFLPNDAVRVRSTRDRIPYALWVEQGFIIVTDGERVDYDVVKKYITETIQERLGFPFDIVEVACDPWNATHLQTQLADEGMTVSTYPQGYAHMTAPSKEVERLLVNRQLRHGGNPVLRWNAANVGIAQDAAGNTRPDKAKSSEKIDGMIALIIAIGRAMVAEDDTSIYEDQGLFSV